MNESIIWIVIILCIFGYNVLELILKYLSEKNNKKK